MTADLDMNSNQILNLPAAVDPTDPVRLGEVDDLVSAAVATEVTAALVVQEALAQIEAGADAQLVLIDAEGDAQVVLVGAAGTAQVSLVNAAGVTQVTNVNDAGTAKLALIAAANAANLYADTTAGLAATASGSYFATPGTNGAALNYYLDNAGTAVLTAQVWGSDAANPQTLRQVQSRYDWQVGSGLRDYPDLLPVRPYVWTFTGGGALASGIATLPAGATWVSPDLNFSPFSIAGLKYIYITLTDETTGALEIKIHNGGTIIAAGNTTTQPSAGVYRQTWNNSAPLGYVTITVTNVGSTTVKCGVPEVTSTDSAYLPRTQFFNDHTIVPENRRVIDWDIIAPYARWGGDSQLWAADEANITLAFDSIGGNDANAGTSIFAAEQNLTAQAGAFAQGAVFGLKYGSAWNQAFTATQLGTTTKGLRGRGYREGSRNLDFPKLSGGTDITANTWTLESAGTWYTTFTAASDCVNDGYSQFTVMETTLADATATPLAATQLLLKQTSKANCIATDGSSFVENVAGTTWRIYVNPRDGIIPSSSTLYSYRVTNIWCLAPWSPTNNRQQGMMSFIEFQHANSGLGIVQGPEGSVFKGLILSHGWTHTFAMEGGELTDSLIYNKGNPVANATVCYCTDGSGISWRFHNLMYYDCSSPIYSHIGPGSNFTSGEVSYCWMINTRKSNDSLQTDTAFACDYVGSTLFEWNYCISYYRQARAGGYVIPVTATYRNNLVRSAAWPSSLTLTENNIFQVENFSDPDNAGNRYPIGINLYENHVVQKNIFYIKNVSNALADYNATIINPLQAGINSPNARQNIFLVDTTLGSGTTVVSEVGAGTWVSDYNVFVICTPGDISSYKYGTSTKNRWDQYITDFAPHDANSLFVDLRDDPRGAKAVFIDPANGDFRWAQTEVAKTVKDYCVTNNCGPDWTIDHWPTVPTVDEARVMLMKAY